MNGARPSSDEVVSPATLESADFERADVTLVPRTECDAEFLYRVYASTRADEVAQTGWPMELQEQFLRTQFNAQTQSYAMQLPTAEHSIIHLRGERVGRLIVERTPTELHLVDIALLPEHRQHGIGSLLMADLIDESRRTGLPVRLFVEKYNPVLRWYEELGFEVIGEDPVYLEMGLHAASGEARV